MIADLLILAGPLYENRAVNSEIHNLRAYDRNSCLPFSYPEHFRNASKEQRDQEARRHEQQVQQLQAEIRQANQALIIKQSEITQLNKDGARLVAEVATSSKRTRDLEVQADQVRADLNQARVDQARMEAERDALRFMGQQQADEVATERAERARLAGELIKVTAQLDAQQQLLVEYRTKLGVAGPAG